MVVLNDLKVEDAEKYYGRSLVGGRKGVGTEHMVVC